MIKSAEALPPTAHYADTRERAVDGWVHAVGLTGGTLGGLSLLGVSLGFDRFGQAAAVAIYAACLVAMFAASMAYNLAKPERRPALRRLDHAAIFLMIAGSYTPFTTLRLHGAWAWGMTIAVWTLALGAAAGKLLAPGLGKGFWVIVYLALGWVAVVAIEPLIAGVSLLALALLVAGGLIYSLGVIIYLNRRLRFRRAIWHGFVVAAAATHFAAILIGVVLPGIATAPENLAAPSRAGATR